MRERGLAVAIKTIRVSDLSGKEVEEDQLAKLVIHEHPKYQGPISLDVLPDEVGELPESDAYVRIEVIQPGERSGQKATISLDRFNSMAGDMDAVVMNAVASQGRPATEEPRRRTRRAAAGGQRGKTNYATLEHAGEPHRGRITEAEKELVRNNLDPVNRRLRDSGMREIDPSDQAMRERYGL